MKVTNKEPRTWLCECGLLNTFDFMECIQCGGYRLDCWDEHDRFVYEIEHSAEYYERERRRWQNNLRAYFLKHAHR